MAWAGDPNEVVSTDLDATHHWAFAAQAISFPCSVFLIAYGLRHMSIFRKKVTNRFPIYIAFADMVFGVTHFCDHLTILKTHRFPGNGACLFYAWALEFFMLATMMNVLAIGVYCLMLLSRGKQIDLGRYDWKLLSLTYGCPFLFSLLPFITDDYGHDGAWCWIKTTPSNAPKIVYNLVPLVVVLILNLGSLSVIYHKVRGSGVATNNASNMGSKVVKRSLLFVLAYIVQFTPLTMYNVVAISGGQVEFGYILAVVTTINLGGLLNGLAYGKAAVKRVEREKRESKALPATKVNNPTLGKDQRSQDNKADSEIGESSTANSEMVVIQSHKRFDSEYAETSRIDSEAAIVSHKIDSDTVEVSTMETDPSPTSVKLEPDMGAISEESIVQPSTQKE